MKTLITAFSLALCGIVALFLALSTVGVDHAVAGSIASVIMGGIPYIRESLDKRSAQRNGPKPGQVLSLEGFGLGEKRMILYGALIIFGAMNFASGIGGLTAVMLDAGQDKVWSAVVIVTCLIVFPTVFCVGRWVGRRSAANGVMTILLIALLARVGASLFDMLVLSHADLVQVLGEDPTLFSVGKQIISGSLLFFILGLLGYWRGRRQQLAAYISYLLRNVSEESRRAIVDLAFEEASRVSGLRLSQLSGT
jgi:hypothetical protein